MPGVPGVSPYEPSVGVPGPPRKAHFSLVPWARLQPRFLLPLCNSLQGRDETTSVLGDVYEHW